MRPLRLLVVCSMIIWCALGGAQPSTRPAGYQQNASFLSRRYLTDSKNSPALTDDLLHRTDEYAIRLLFPNGGLLDSSGHLSTPSSAVKLFLDHVRAAESRTRTKHIVMPYLNAYSAQDRAHQPNLRLDLGSRSVREHIIAECLRYVSPHSDGSYVRGAKRAFDGVVLDIEPAGDSALFASFKLLLSELRASFDNQGLRQKKIGIAAPQHTERTPKPNWGWNSSDYYYMAKYVEYVIAMTYDSGVKDSVQYQPWMADQTTRILRAVSGATWNFDREHPSPSNGVKVLIGLPGFYTITKAHNPDFENVALGAPGVWQGLARLESNDPISLAYFLGVTMYTHDTGASDSMYARYSRDWAWWREDWLHH